VALPLTQDKDHPVLDHQVRHEVILQNRCTKVGTILRFMGEADDRVFGAHRPGAPTYSSFRLFRPMTCFTRS